ncbi:MAG: PGF-CTERM sorting domain-containing protein, partial [Halobacteriota archaeon]|nr:PGF-CTERM sorting domain-containing protein [Halobacteriota archaeon]
NEMIGVTNEGLPVFDFEANYWIDSEAEIDAIVLYPEVVEELIGKSAGNEVENLVISDGEKILLYNVETDLKSSEVAIGEIKSNPDKYTGKVVTFTGSDMGVTASVQEMIKESQGECPPVDVLLNGAVIWCRPPPTLEGLQTGTLIAVGASSHHQDQAIKQEDGSTEVFEYTGKIISSEQMDGSLPDDLVFITYKREKVGDISVDEMTDEVKNRIGGMVLMIEESLQEGETILEEPATQITPPPTSTPELTPTPPEEGIVIPHPEEEYYEEPGFEMTLAIAGMLAVGYLLRWKK